MSDLDQTPRGEYRTLPGRLRDSATQARAVDRAELLREAAAELERLYIVIDAYCASSAAACREIAQLKERLHDATAQSADMGHNSVGRGVCDLGD